MPDADVCVSRLGEHPMAVAALYSFLLDRHQASDIDGTLTVNILKVNYKAALEPLIESRLTFTVVAFQIRDNG